MQSLEIDQQQVRAVGGPMYSYSLARQGSFLYRIEGDGLHAPTTSLLVLFENGLPLAAAHQLHEDIRNKGMGRYSHWGRTLLFSSSDGSDVSANGRQYSAQGRASLRPWVQLLFLVTVVISAAPAIAYFSGMYGSRRIVLIILSTLLAVCVAASADHVWNGSGGIPLLSPDTASYVGLGIIRPPGYYWFMRVLSWMGDVGTLLVPAQFGVLVAGLLALGWGLGTAFGSRAVGLVAAIILVIDASVLRFTVDAMSEALFLAAVCFHLASMLSLFGRFRWKVAVLAGIALGLAAVIRPIGYFLFPGVLVATFFIGWRNGWRLLPLVGGPAVSTLMISVLLNIFIHGVAAPHKFAGLVLFGHVAHMITPEDAARDNDLRAIYERILPMIEEVRRSSYPEEFYIAQMSTYNPMLWGNAVPYMSEALKSRGTGVDQTNPYIAVNDNLQRMAISLIKHHLREYVRLVAAHVYGMWKTLFYFSAWGGNLDTNYLESAKTGNNIHGYGDIADSLWAKSQTADIAAMRDLKNKTPLVEQAWFLINGILANIRWGIVAGAAAAFFLGIFFPHAVRLRALAFLSASLWAYVGAVAASQPTLWRYALIAEPGTIAFAIGGIWLTGVSLANIVRHPGAGGVVSRGTGLFGGR